MKKDGPASFSQTRKEHKLDKLAIHSPNAQADQHNYSASALYPSCNIL